MSITPACVPGITSEMNVKINNHLLSLLCTSFIEFFGQFHANLDNNLSGFRIKGQLT